jgi:hypothetical protein
MPTCNWTFYKPIQISTACIVIRFFITAFVLKLMGDGDKNLKTIFRSVLITYCWQLIIVWGHSSGGNLEVVTL